MTNQTWQRRFLLKRYSVGMCLDLVFVSIFDILCVVGGAQLACCILSWLHTVVDLARARSDRLRLRANVVTCAVTIHRQVTSPGWPSRLVGVVRSCVLSLRIEGTR